jgi:hypothetical protein
VVSVNSPAGFIRKLLPFKLKIGLILLYWFLGIDFLIKCNLKVSTNFVESQFVVDSSNPRLKKRVIY